MADTHLNRSARGGRGMFGEGLVTHVTGSGRTLVAGKPASDQNPTFHGAGTIPQAAVRNAGTYASFAETQEVYVRTAVERGMTPYALAVADWYGAPKVLEIDVDAWTGNAGETIRVRARDNVCVARVLVTVRDAEGTVLESGEAVVAEAGSLWWNYTTQSSVVLTPFPTVQAVAMDLPGNRDSFTIS